MYDSTFFCRFLVPSQKFYVLPYLFFQTTIKFIDITIRMLIALKPQSITRFMISFLKSEKGGSDKRKPK